MSPLSVMEVNPVDLMLSAVGPVLDFTSAFWQDLSVIHLYLRLLRHYLH